MTLSLLAAHIHASFLHTQYPEMSRYLLPIDDGDEVQHLGRTLECQLCGLRGKRCHLTLHFKVKSARVNLR